MAVGHETQPGQDGYASSIQGTPWLVQSSRTGGFEDDATAQLGKEEKFIVAASTLAPILLKKALTNSGKRSDNAVEMNKTGMDKTLRSSNEIEAFSLSNIVTFIKSISIFIIL